MSTTPLTDAFAAPNRGLGTGYYQALAFARDLEQKLAYANEVIEQRNKMLTDQGADAAALRAALDEIRLLQGDKAEDDTTAVIEAMAATACSILSRNTAGTDLLEQMRKLKALAKSAEEFARLCITDGEVSQLDAQTLYEQARNAINESTP